MQKQKYKYVKQNSWHAHFFPVAYITWTLLSALKINTNIIISFFLWLWKEYSLYYYCDMFCVNQ